MQSVAILKYEKTQHIFIVVVCCSADAHLHHPPMVMVTSSTNQQCPTLDMPQYNCDIYATLTVCPTQTSLTSLAHELHYVVSANYYVAVAWETTGAEDHM